MEEVSLNTKEPVREIVGTVPTSSSSELARMKKIERATAAEGGSPAKKASSSSSLPLQRLSSSSQPAVPINFWSVQRQLNQNLKAAEAAAKENESSQESCNTASSKAFPHLRDKRKKKNSNNDDFFNCFTCGLFPLPFDELHCRSETMTMIHECVTFGCTTSEQA